ncbi:MAG: mechanosensitive ion channel [Candidatus Competibacteraceae bacterium]|nr:mechanosensitive ion channel [Candidatus Competibacteraceae bacterium]HRX71366.1 mechanosensitive ion channel [Candidatus Competibacteraceae bacterium]
MSFFLIIVSSALPTRADPAPPIDPAKVAEQQDARRQALLQDQQTIKSTRQELEAQIADLPRQLEALQPDQINESTVEQTQVDVKSARLRLESIFSDLDNADRHIKDLQKSISELEAREQLLKNPAKEPVEGLADRAAQLEHTQQLLVQQRGELELETLNLANVQSQVEAAKLRLNLTQQWQERVEKIFLLRQEQSRQDAQTELITRLQNDLNLLYDRAAVLKKYLSQGQGALPLEIWQRQTTELQTVEEQINLLNLDRHLAETTATLAQIKDLLQNPTAQVSDLQQGVEKTNKIIQDLSRSLELLQQKTTVYQQQIQVIERREVAGSSHHLRDEELKLVSQLLTELDRRISQVQDQLAQAHSIAAQLDNYHDERLRKDLFTRQQYPKTAEAWRQLLQELTTAPWVLGYQVRLSVETALRGLLDATIFRWLGLAALEVMLIWLLWMARSRLRQAMRRFATPEAGSSFVRQWIGNILVLVWANLLGIGVAAALVALLWVVEVPQPGFGILMTLALLWVGIKLPISLAWLFLVSPRLPDERRHPSFYRQLFWTLICGSLVVALVILAHLSDLPDSVANTLDHLLMLYGFWAVSPVLRIRRLVMDQLSAVYRERFWFVVLRYSSLLMPLSLLGAAVLGLLGYLQLAWLIAGYLLIFIAILIGWLVARSLLNDVVVALKNFAVTHSGYGLLWTQDIITPLHRIANLLLFLGAWMALFRAYGWTGESAVIASIWAFLERPLFTFGAADITAWRIILTITILMVVIWLGQWSRAISYRWILSHLSDLGVRHSLSVFTQYTVVLVGVLIILRIVGIDLTTLAVFAGAVGVGIGLGMQNLANNFVSGLLLLIERPLSSGDIVQVGNHLGEVTGIGMRSLTVQTFDNESVIIPNSDVISNAFINWTHGDRVIRTILWIGISYDADPHQAQAVIEQAMREHPAILDDPKPQALLWDFADSSVKFRVQYYIDISRYSLLTIHHEVLFSIWDRFKAADICIPYPQHDLYIKAWPPGTGELAKPVSLG